MSPHLPMHRRLAFVILAALPACAEDAMDHGAMSMQGMLGPYSMMREASGTSWQPDSSPHEGIMGMAGSWQTMVHGALDGIYDHQGGPRGGEKSFSASMLMLMASRPVGDATVGVRGMFSLDPLMGKAGYPLLLQTGETADGRAPLIDRQHPHNAFMELAATYSIPMGAGRSAFLYGGLPGEPALGPSAFMHRFSGGENPEAPITRHWLDSTHVTNGVVTVGYVVDRVKIEASAFHGREPDQYRYRIEPGALDSQSLRITYNPADDWSMQVSHGRIATPEALTPDVDVRRTTASVTYNVRLPTGPWQTTFAWGRNASRPGRSLDGFLLESAASITPRDTIFARAERVEKDELFDEDSPRARESFRVGKLSIGATHDFHVGRSYRIGVGALASVYSIPASLAPEYGAHPTSYMVFARIKLG